MKLCFDFGTELGLRSMATTQVLCLRDVHERMNDFDKLSLRQVVPSFYRDRWNLSSLANVTATISASSRDTGVHVVLLD